MDKARRGDFKDLVDIMARLRSGKGCPWDREQTRQSLTPYLIEESYEVLEAIEGGNPDKLKEELGDLLFQILFHSQIAEEQGEFDIWAVIEDAKEKMIARHPHVFGKESADNPEEVLRHWEEIKRRERGNDPNSSLLDGVPRSLPALLRAHRVQTKAARVGFDWSRAEDVVSKAEEELAELKAALRERREFDARGELGDLLFSIVNLARHLSQDPEDALRGTIDKFCARFRKMERALAARGKSLDEVDLEELDRLWEESKGASPESLL
ncbi:MAG: nucleoside triphosphate pyrophosphohydrolase [Nitrospinota bacterium]